jgi:hypothetical protein
LPALDEHGLVRGARIGDVPDGGAREVACRRRLVEEGVEPDIGRAVPLNGVAGRASAAWSRVRPRLGRARRAALTAVQVLDPSRFAAEAAPASAAVGVVGVYRARNLAIVRDLVAACPPGWVIRLWSLDADPPPDLVDVTVGTGPGTRFALLNRLADAIPPAARRDALVVTDDDVRFVVGDPSRLVGTGLRLGLDLYQPAHVALTTGSWTFVRKRPLVLARETGFVEQGPLFVLSGPAQPVLLPLPEDAGMAWGVEAGWWRACREAGLRQGIVDAVDVRHLGSVAAAYDRGEQEERLRRALRAAGISDMSDIQRTYARVRPTWGAGRLRLDGRPAR